jgi:hypothetical protein
MTVEAARGYVQVRVIEEDPDAGLFRRGKILARQLLDEIARTRHPRIDFFVEAAVDLERALDADGSEGGRPLRGRG